MTKKILAITFIYTCTAVGWFILAGATIVRTQTQDRNLRGAVSQLWGAKQSQAAPTVYYKPPTAKAAKEYLALDASEVNVDLKLDHRRKGLLWYSTYHVTFAGKYTVKNNSDHSRQVVAEFAFPAKGAVYDNFRLAVDGRRVNEVEINSGKVTKTLELAPSQSQTLEISYNSQGLDQWSYDFGTYVRQVKNFSLIVNTDFEKIDFPAESISPTDKQSLTNGWKLTWKYTNLLTGVKIAVVTPKKLNPGPWVSRVTAAAPVSLFLFFFLLFVFTTVKKIKLHPMNYFFVGTAFFSFHLLLAYLVDHVPLPLAFAICSMMSVLLVLSYMRLVVGWRVAFLEITLFQLIYLVFFSYTFFFEGYTGLAITILCICTLFVVMQFTGKLDWETVFAKNKGQLDKKG